MLTAYVYIVDTLATKMCSDDYYDQSKYVTSYYLNILLNCLKDKYLTQIGIYKRTLSCSVGRTLNLALRHPRSYSIWKDLSTGSQKHTIPSNLPSNNTLYTLISACS